MVKLYELYDQIGQLKEDKMEIVYFYEEKKSPLVMALIGQTKKTRRTWTWLRDLVQVFS